MILVGRSSIEQRLRRDASIELVRARNAVDAIGELASPIDAASPPACVVLLAPDTLVNGEVESFAAAARSVDASARIFALYPEGTANGQTCAPLDGTMSEEADVAALRARMAPAALAPKAAAPSPAAPPRDPGAAAPSNRAAMLALLTGGDPVPPAMAAISARFPGETISFHPRPREDPGNALPGVPDPAEMMLPVAHRGAVFGWVSAPVRLAEALRPFADELALWVALWRQREDLQTAAFTDHLTGAFNRRYFELFFARALREAVDHRRCVTLLLFDIDDFKSYNDRFGHAAGDEVLTETVRLLRSVVRPDDRVCRIGGDEFAVVFHEPEGPRDPGSRHPTSIFQIARRFQQALRDHRFPKLISADRGRLTVSGGLATFPWDGHEPASLLARADALILESKQAGKNVICYGPGALLRGDAD
ncbi:MAG: GGDEF domain-containing protein [Phycisphaerales bacterium]|nr:GGDEF domain-containing protein [Phycisphaerales bacterium]